MTNELLPGTDDRGSTGNHILKAPSGSFVIAYWTYGSHWTIDGSLHTPQELAVRNYVYVGVFTEPDEVDRLQERVDDLEYLEDLVSDPGALIEAAFFEGWRESHLARKGSVPDDSDWRKSHARFKLDEFLNSIPKPQK